eukprot:9209016-Alexandrium_andersonii.AAC.1
MAQRSPRHPRLQRPPPKPGPGLGRCFAIYRVRKSMPFAKAACSLYAATTCAGPTWGESTATDRPPN